VISNGYASSGLMIRSRWTDNATIAKVVSTLWGILHLAFAANRSMWQDEYMRYQQMHMGLKDSFISLFQEPSPFAAGELILDHIARIILSSFTSFELWGRFPSVLFGALTVYLAALHRRWVLVALLGLSVSLTSFSTQSRPYASLIFCGAIAFRMMADTTPLSRGERWLAWFGVLFGHIYGICYVGLGALWTRQWRLLVGSIIAVVCTMGLYMTFHSGHVTGWLGGEITLLDFPAWFQWGCITLYNNRIIAKALFLPFLLGLGVILWLHPLKNGLGVTLFFLCALGGPQLANIFGNYSFVPRQMVGGLFAALYIPAAAAAAPFPHKYRIGILLLLFSPALLLGANAWRQYVMHGKPPVAEQPLHKYKQRVAESLEAGDHNVLLLDPGGMGYHYFQRALGPDAVTIVKAGPYEVIKRCWPRRSYCVYHFDVSDFAWKDLNELALSPAFMKFVNGTMPAFDRIIANAYSLTLPTKVAVQRTW
jgi:hypothetical protein